MADTTLKQLLVKLNLDASSIPEVISAILDQLAEMQATQTAAAQAAAEANIAQISQQQEITAAVEDTATAQAAVASATATAATQQQATTAAVKDTTAAVSATSDATKDALAQAKLATAEAQARAASERAVTAELQRQGAEIRLQMTQARQLKSQQAGSGSGDDNGVLNDIIKSIGGLAGGGLTGSVFAGALTGGGIGASIPAILGQIKELGKAFADLVLESSQLTHITETFNSLSRSIGAVPVQMLEQLKTATGGLVSEMDLMRSANTILLQGIPLTSDQIVKLTGSVSQLAIAQGKDATEAMGLLARGLASGRTSMVAYYLGLQDTVKEQLKLDQELPESVKYWAQYVDMLEAVNAQNARIGPQAETLGESVTKLTTTLKDLEDSFGADAAASKFGQALQSVADGLNSILVALNSGVLSKLSTLSAIFTGLVTAGPAGVIGAIAAASGLKGQQEAQQKQQSQEQIETTPAAPVPPSTPWSTGATGTDIGLSYSVPGTPRSAQPLPGPSTAGTQYDEAKKSADAYYSLIKAQTALSDETVKASTDAQQATLENLYKTDQISFETYQQKKLGIQQKYDDARVASLQQLQSAQLDKYDKDNAQMLSTLSSKQTAANAPGSTVSAQGRSDLAQAIKNIAEQRQAIIADSEKEILAITSQGDTQQIAAAGATAEQLRKIQEDELTAELQALKQNTQEKVIAARQQYSDGEISAKQMTDAIVATYREDYTAYVNLMSDKQTRAGENNVKLLAVQKEEAAGIQQIQKEEQAAIQAGIKQQQQLQTESLEATLKSQQETSAGKIAAAKQEFSEGAISAAQLTDVIVSELQKQLAATATAKNAEAALVGTTEKEKAKLYAEESQAAQKTYTEIAAVQAGTAKEATSQFKTEIDSQVKMFQDLAAAAATSPSLGKIMGGGKENNAQQQDIKEQEVSYLGDVNSELKSFLNALAQGPQALQAFIKQLQGIAAFGRPADADVLKYAQGVSVTANQQYTNAAIQGTAPIAGELPLLSPDATNNTGGTAQTGNVTQLSPAVTEAINALSQILNPLRLFNTQIMQIGTTITGNSKNMTDLINSFVTLGDVVATALQGLGAALSEVGLKKAGAGVTAGLASLTSYSNYEKWNAQTGTVNSGISQGSDPVSGVLQSGENLFGGQGNMQLNLVAFSKSLAAATVEVGTFVNSIKGAGGNVEQAGIGGVTSGMQLGSGLTTDLSKMSGLSGLASAAPYVGAVVGAVTGIISVFSAKATEAANKMAQTIQTSFNDMLESYNEGQMTLVQAIQSANQQEQSAISSLSGSKQGRKLLPGIEQSMDQTISQLEAKQQQAFTTMQNNLDVLASPEPYQAQVQQIQSIIQAYDDYINAGGNVATANKFLMLSYQQLAQQGLTALNQDQQNAINDALNYNNLLTQRQQLIQQTTDQISSILSGGAASRTQTKAMSEEEQVANVQDNSEQQMEQLNQQIAVTGYRVQAEQQIFSLASSRIGLETQLVALQNAQTAQSMQQIQALQGIISAVSRGTPVTSLAILMQLLGLPSLPSVPGLTTAGLNPTTGGTAPVGSAGSTAASGASGPPPTSTQQADAVETSFLASYNVRGSQGLGGFSGEQ